MRYWLCRYMWGINDADVGCAGVFGELVRRGLCSASVGD